MIPTEGTSRSTRQSGFLPIDRPGGSWSLPEPKARFQNLLSSQMKARVVGRGGNNADVKPRPRVDDGRANGYQDLIASAANKHGVNPALIAAVIDTESGFNPNAVSSAGAKGLMQLMDGTAKGLGVTDSFDPTQNVMGGARLLRQLLDRYKGDVKLALAAYNAGPGAVDRFGGVPPYGETQNYIPKVMAALQRHGGADIALRPGSQRSETWR